MKLISSFIGVGVIAVLTPKYLSIIFDLVSYITLLFGAIYLFLKPNHYYARNRLKSLKYFYIVLVVVFISYTTNYLFSALGIGDEVLFSITGLKLGTLGLATVILFGGTFLIVSALEITEREKSRFLFTIVCAGGLSAAITIAAWATTTGAVYQRYNFTPPLTDSQGLHLYYMIVTVLFGIVLMKNQSMLSKTKRAVVLGACALAIFSTSTVMVREGWIIFSIVLLFSWYLLSDKSHKTKITVVSTIGSVFIITIVSFMYQSNLLDDIHLDSSGEGGDSAVVRLIMIQNALSVIYDNPVWGVGYGNYSLYALQTVQLSGGEEVEVTSPHNALILIMAETGIIGLIAFSLLCTAIVINAKQRLNDKYGPVTRAMAGTLFPLLLILCLDQFISNSLLLPPPAERRIVQFSYLLWLTFAILVARPTKYQLNKAKDYSKSLSAITKPTLVISQRGPSQAKKYNAVGSK